MVDDRLIPSLAIEKRGPNQELPPGSSCICVVKIIKHTRKDFIGKPQKIQIPDLSFSKTFRKGLCISGTIFYVDVKLHQNDGKKNSEAHDPKSFNFFFLTHCASYFQCALLYSLKVFDMIQSIAKHLTTVMIS